MLRWLILCAMLLAPAAARAEWREAASRHFVIYSEGSDGELRRTAVELELYDALLRSQLKAPDDAGDKVTIYLMPSQAAVRAAMEDAGESGVAGFYVASPRGAVIVGMQSSTGDGVFDLTRRDILFHEYAHHLMMRHSGTILPLWYSEGVAEYYGMSRFADGAVVETGRPAPHRLAVMRERDDWIPINRLLAAKRLEQIDGDEEMLHAQGWLLVHFLANDRARQGQLERFHAVINEEADEQAAIEAAFGDTKMLEQELRAYARHTVPKGQYITLGTRETGPVTTRPLRPAEVAIIGHEARLAGGVRPAMRQAFAREVRAIAAAYPDDPRAAALLTAAEHMANNAAAAGDAVDRWLALEPQAPRALMYKSMIGFAALAATGRRDAQAWTRARRWIEWARALDPSDPMILDIYYDSFTAEGVPPPIEAQAGLVEAVHLLPQFDDLRLKLATDYESRNQIKAAILVLKPAAFRDHLAGYTTGRESARQMLERLEHKSAAIPARLAGQTARAGMKPIALTP